MDVNGARELSKRLEAQQHWRQATAVQQGDQPAADPDASDLIEMADGLRRYRRESDGTSTNGAKTPAVDRLCKRLVDGRWETSYEADGPELTSR
jgi:hypothetical protein